MLRVVGRSICLFILLVTTCTGCSSQTRDIDRAISATAAANEVKRASAVLALGDLCQRVTDEEAKNKGLAVLEGKTRDESPRVQSAAALALAELKAAPVGTLERLVNLLEDSNEDVRINAAAAAFIIAEQRSGDVQPSSERIINALLARFVDEVPTVRAHAIRACAALGRMNEEVTKKIAGMLKDPEAGVRIQAIEALASAGPAARPYAVRIRELLTDNNDTVREIANEALKRIER